MMSPELSILIAHVPSQRATFLSRLLCNLQDQICFREDVEVIVHQHETKPMGRKFNELYEAASGRLSVQIDDDDQVPSDYVEKVLAVSSTHDFVGYKAMLTVNNAKAGIFTCDPARAEHKPYSHAEKVRHVTPKCPLLTTQARKFVFGSYLGSDWDWVKAVIEDGFPHNPTFIDEVLYHYDCWPTHSLGTSPVEWTPQRTIEPYPYNARYFTWIE